MSAALELAGRALAAVAEPADGAMALVTRERSLLLRFARSRPTQATSLDDVTIELALTRDGHVGRAATNAADAGSLARCAAAAAGAARAAAARERGTYPGFPAPAPARAHDGFDADTAALDPQPGGAALREAIDVAARAGCEAHGAWSTGDVETAVASSAGAAVTDRVTDAFAKVVCIAPRTNRSGYSAAAGAALDRIDMRALAERAARKATAPGALATLPPGEHTTVLEPHAVAELLTMLAVSAFDGLAHTEGRGALAGRLRTPVASPQVNLSDSPRFPGTLHRAFDAEGVPKAPLPLIQDGVAHRVVHDTRSGALAGARSTGHALAPGGAPEGPRPTNLVMIGGGAWDEEELCAGVERGVYVTRLWYANLVRPRESLVTAVTRDGTFLIEDGRIARPLEDLRLTDSALGVLARVEALSAQPALVADGEFYGRRFANGVVCPALRAAGVRFSGAAG